MPSMVSEESTEDMYCFRCNDRESGVSDVFVHVDILWEHFSAKPSPFSCATVFSLLASAHRSCRGRLHAILRAGFFLHNFSCFPEVYV